MGPGHEHSDFGEGMTDETPDLISHYTIMFDGVVTVPPGNGRKLGVDLWKTELEALSVLLNRVRKEHKASRLRLKSVKRLHKRAVQKRRRG